MFQAPIKVSSEDVSKGIENMLALIDQHLSIGYFRIVAEDTGTYAIYSPQSNTPLILRDSSKNAQDYSAQGLSLEEIGSAVNDLLYGTSFNKVRITAPPGIIIKVLESIDEKYLRKIDRIYEQ